MKSTDQETVTKWCSNGTKKNVDGWDQISLAVLFFSPGKEKKMEDNRGTGMAEAVLVLTFLIILMLLFREKLIGMIVWRLEHLFMKAQ